MSAKAGLTAGPNGINFLRESLSTPGVPNAKKINIFFLNLNLFSKIDLKKFYGYDSGHWMVYASQP